MWDEEKKKWVDKNADPDDDANGANVAPPSDMELSRNNSSADVAAMGQQQPSVPPGRLATSIEGKILTLWHFCLVFHKDLKQRNN